MYRGRKLARKDFDFWMKKYIVTSILVMLALLIWVPLWMIVTGSLMGNEELAGYMGGIMEGSSGMASWNIFPKYPTLRSYIEILLDSPRFFTMFWNSCIQVIPSIVGQVVIAVPAAWAFARFRFRGRNVLFFLYIVLMILPFQVTMVSSYLVLSKLHLMDTHLALILPNIFSAFPVFIMVKFFQAIPISLMEAAKLDGAGECMIFLKVGVPIGASGIVSIVVLSFLESWNAMEQPITFLKNKALWPLTLYLPNITADKIGISFVASVIIMLPALLIFVNGQEYLEQGITASGIKE